MALFNAFSPLNGGKPSDYYRDRLYPLDLNGAQDYARPKTAYSFSGYPQAIGHINGLLPQFDSLVFAQAYGKDPYGPWMGLPQGPLSQAFPDMRGGFAKVQ